MELAKNALTKPDMIDAATKMKIETKTSVEMLINVASEKIENYCNREFKRETRTERYESGGGNWLGLRAWPVHEVEYIKLYDEEVEDFDVNKTNGLVYRSSGWKRPYEDEKYNIEVKYEAGYYLPGHADRDLPQQVEFACILLTKNLLERLSRDFDVQQVRLPDISETYFRPGEQEELPMATASLLSDYKRVLV